MQAIHTTGKSYTHYGKKELCQVSGVLPRVFSRAVGKDDLCRVSEKNTFDEEIHSAKKQKKPRQRNMLGKKYKNTWQRITLGKEL